LVAEHGIAGLGGKAKHDPAAAHVVPPMHIQPTNSPLDCPAQKVPGEEHEPVHPPPTTGWQGRVVVVVVAVVVVVVLDAS
jgi:hypothetical protein